MSTAPHSPWVLLRGLSRSAAHWGDFPNQLAQAIDGPVLSIDLPGNGLDAALPSPAHIASMTQHVRQRLQATGHTGPVHVLALSMGAMVACHWASQWPQEVRSAVLVNSSLRGLSPWYQRMRPGAATRLLGRLLLPATPKQWETTIFQLTSQRPALQAACVADWVALRQAQPVSRLNALRQLLAAARFQPPAPPPVPLLVLAGGADQLVDARCAQAMAQHWHATLALHPSAGHDLPLDEPAWLLAQLQHWQSTHA